MVESSSSGSTGALEKIDFRHSSSKSPFVLLFAQQPGLPAHVMATADDHLVDLDGFGFLYEGRQRRGVAAQPVPEPEPVPRPEPAWSSGGGDGNGGGCFERGASVRVRGLVSAGAQQHNGATATVLGWDAAKGRYAVRLKTGRKLAVRPANLEEEEEEEEEEDLGVEPAVASCVSGGVLSDSYDAAAVVRGLTGGDSGGAHMPVSLERLVAVTRTQEGRAAAVAAGAARECVKLLAQYHGVELAADGARAHCTPPSPSPLLVLVLRCLRNLCVGCAATQEQLWSSGACTQALELATAACTPPHTGGARWPPATSVELACMAVQLLGNSVAGSSHASSAELAWALLFPSGFEALLSLPLSRGTPLPSSDGSEKATPPSLVCCVAMTLHTTLAKARNAAVLRSQLATTDAGLAITLRLAQHQMEASRPAAAGTHAGGRVADNVAAGGGDAGHLDGGTPADVQAAQFLALIARGQCAAGLLVDTYCALRTYLLRVASIPLTGNYLRLELSVCSMMASCRYRVSRAAGAGVPDPGGVTTATTQQQADDDDSCRWSRAMGLQWTSDARGAELQSSQLRWLRGMCEAVLETVRPGVEIRRCFMISTD
jgi:hypothetical protein